MLRPQSTIAFHFPLTPFVRCNRTRTRARARARTGSLLLDLFIASVLFATCMVAIGQYGSQSLRIAERCSLERLARIKAESVIAMECISLADSKDRTWQETAQSIPFEIQTRWKDTSIPGVKECSVRVTALKSSLQTFPSVSLCRFADRPETN